MSAKQSLNTEGEKEDHKRRRTDDIDADSNEKISEKKHTNVECDNAQRNDKECDYLKYPAVKFNDEDHNTKDNTSTSSEFSLINDGDYNNEDVASGSSEYHSKYDEYENEKKDEGEIENGSEMEVGTE
jgi:hypothetical protein